MTSPFDPIAIGSLELPNRFVMAPIKTAYGTTSGQTTDQQIAFFGRRAEGGVGLVISEPLYVDKRGQEHPKQLGIDGDDKREGLQRLVDAVHRSGARIFAHLNHAGRAANPKASGEAPEAPSAVVCPRTGIEPEVLSESRITELVQAFTGAALRAKQCGFDGVELQFGLGYLVSQFLSPKTNARSDLYGGDPERRLRFAREVYSGVREVVGDDFPVGVRISGSEQAPGGLDVDDAKKLGATVEAWGVNLIHVASGSNCESPPWYFQHMALPPGVNERLAASVRQEVEIPVVAAGRLGDPARIRYLLESESIDMIALGRPLLADPDLPDKMREGRDDEVMPCGHCLQGCFGNVKAGKGIGCNFNPIVGHELDVVSAPAQPKNVIVVGGGPAGIQAALTAESRGHRVTLFEKNQLGGQLKLAGLPPHKERLGQPLHSLVTSLQRSEVDIHLGEEATCSELEALAPDVIVLGTGSCSASINVPGLGDVIAVDEVLLGTREAGTRVLILGGGMVGLEVAEFLAERGRKVAVVEILETVANDMDLVSRTLLLKRLASLPVEIHTQTELLNVEDGRRAFVDHLGTERELGEFDSVIVATGSRPFEPLSEELLEKGFDVKIVGDARETGNVYDAITSGYRAGMSI